MQNKTTKILGSILVVIVAVLVVLIFILRNNGLEKSNIYKTSQFSLQYNNEAVLTTTDDKNLKGSVIFKDETNKEKGVNISFYSVEDVNFKWCDNPVIIQGKEFCVSAAGREGAFNDGVYIYRDGNAELQLWFSAADPDALSDDRYIDLGSLEIYDHGPITSSTETRKEWREDHLGISFSYPISWGTVQASVPYALKNFEYEISFSNSSVRVVGLSNPYSSPGRDGYSTDLSEAALKDLTMVCEPRTPETVKNKEGIEGVYTLARIVIGLGDCGDYQIEHWAAYDVNKNIKNIIVSADPNKISKEEFLKFVTSISF